MNLKESLKGKIPEKDMDYVYRAFEIIGDIAVIQVPPNIEKYKNEMAQTLCSLHKNVKIVLRKIDDVSGKYRVGKYEKLIGDRTETIYTENSIRLKADPTKAYFSAKLGTERHRITQQVKDKEYILCMFAGIGPFPINIAKVRDVHIKAVEINPQATKLFAESLKLNRLKGKIEIFTGDVVDIVPNFPEKFNRILMPAPKDASDYLDLAMQKIKKGGIINYYAFVPTENFESLENDLKGLCRSLGKKVDILDIRKCGNIGICQLRVAVDIKILD
ncbi:MAG: class I SAM-dependent methyltransferase family protein [archaeon]|nr:class I SAM-dependent methyltransferase family protein [archaeon]